MASSMNQNQTPHIIICDPIHPVGVDRLRQIGKVTILEQKLTPDELIDTAQDAEAMIVRSRTRLTGDLLQVLPRLRVIGRAGAGLDNIDVSTARARGTRKN